MAEDQEVDPAPIDWTTHLDENDRVEYRVSERQDVHIV